MILFFLSFTLTLNAQERPEVEQSSPNQYVEGVFKQFSPSRESAVAQPEPKKECEPVSGWKILSVKNDIATVSGPDGIEMTIDSGQELKGVGKIESVKRVGSRWVATVNGGSRCRTILEKNNFPPGCEYAEGYNLEKTHEGTATVDTPSGPIELQVNSRLPKNAGEVAEIKRYQGQFLVLFKNPVGKCLVILKH